MLGVCTRFHRSSVVRAPFCPLRSSVHSPPWGSPCRHVGRSSAPCTPPQSLTVPAGGRSVVSIASVSVFPSWQEVVGSVSTWVSLFSLGETFSRYDQEALSEACACACSQSPAVPHSATAAPGHPPDPGIEALSPVSLCPLPWQACSSHRAPWAASEACSSVRRLRGERPHAQHPDHEAASRDEQAPLFCARPQNCCPDRKQLWEFCERGRVVLAAAAAACSLGWRLALSIALHVHMLWVPWWVLFVVESCSMVRTDPGWWFLLLKGCGLFSSLDPLEEGCCAHATPCFDDCLHAFLQGGASRPPWALLATTGCVLLTGACQLPCTDGTRQYSHLPCTGMPVSLRY